VKRARSHWDFPYEPVVIRTREDAGVLDVVVATATATSAAILAEALAPLGELVVTALVDEGPLHWFRLTAAAPASRRDVATALKARGIPVRYVAPARASDLTLAPALELPPAAQGTPRDWPLDSSRPTRAGREGDTWFLGPSGVDVNRRICGTGAGVRVAVIDDDAADLERLDLERTVLVGVDQLSRASGHGALMVAWAVGSRGDDDAGFAGVAPGASVRLYCVPKPGVDVVSLPLAIVTAVADGADVVVCATYVEATTSPMLDDALQLASRRGRRGLGTPVVLPTGRETSSPGISLHASLSLSFADPASDPRVHCIAPSGRGGGWFTWADSRGRLRPFANRGPAVRWLAPGDDLPYPFGSHDRLFHAESSGASAIATGVIALVLAGNPDLRQADLHAILSRSSRAPAPDPANAALADPFDVLPLDRDRDGHDAKCGYGRPSAVAAVGSASDPVALALFAMGEDDAARRWLVRPGGLYSQDLARWAVGALLGRPDLEHAVRALARHARLLAQSPARAPSHGRGAFARQVGLVVRALLAECAPPPPLQAELTRALESLAGTGEEAPSSTGAGHEGAAVELFAALWPRPASSAVPVVATGA
jgi:hypothetical protein